MTPRVVVDEDAEDMYDSLVRLNAGLGCTLDVGYIQCYTWSDVHSDPGWQEERIPRALRSPRHDQGGGASQSRRYPGCCIQIHHLVVAARTTRLLHTFSISL